MTQPDRVERAADIDPRWMTAALCGSGFKSGFKGEVTKLSFAPIGTGQMADSFRFELSYDAAGSAEGAPSSVVLKMQAADELSRKAGSSGAYESEVSFYMDLDPTLSIRTPQCYYAALPDDHGRFALVLEDLAPAEQGDQIKGCSIDQARSAVVNLAGLHGPRWCDPSLRDLGWIRCVSEAETEAMQLLLVSLTERFVEYYGSRVSARDAVVLRAFAAKSGTWLFGRGERFAPVHGDYRLDNLLFATPAGGSPVATVDWQTLGIGLPGRDLGYFLGNSLCSEDRRESERELVRAYHEALIALGVTGHSLEECFDDYRYGQFQGLFITVLASVNLTHTDRGDEMFMAMSTRACEAIRDLESLDLL
jgi:hypothetical protein